MTDVHYQTVDVDGVEVFYCEPGNRWKPTLLLLHGFRRRATCSMT
ncbi:MULTISPECIES: alpha/beta fold hydrolase [unclassified Aureimonas]|nr:MULTISPECIES: hypothetical protein [unclassified Aureimonas]